MLKSTASRIFRWERSLGQQEATLRREVVPRYLTKASQYKSDLVHVVKAMMHLFYRASTEPEGTNRGTDDARREAGLAIALQPNDPEAHIMMAWALIAAGKPQEGLNFVRAAMRLNPNYPSHYVLFNAAAHYGMDDLEQAANILREGLKRDPQAIALAPMAASVYAHLGLRKEARAAFVIWERSEDPAERRYAILNYGFPNNWVNDNNRLNTRRLDGLHLAALPLEVTVTSLKADLKRQEPSAQYTAAQTLGWFGPAAAPAIPELIEALGSAHRLVRKGAAIALGKIGPDAKAAVPGLTAITDEPLIGFHAKEALNKINGE